MPRSRTRAVLGVLAAAVVAALLLGGCVVGPSQRPPVATRGGGPGAPGVPTPETEVPAPAPPLLPPLVPVPAAPAGFADCTAEVRAALGAELGGRDLRFGCQSVPVGGRSGSARAEVGVLQVTLGPVPPGGPVPIAVVGEAGGPAGSERAARLASTMPEPLLAGTALYGVDLRGTGNSEPIDCITPTTREALVDADPLAADTIALDPLRGAAATAARTCSQVLENALTDYRTGVDAEDLEEVRVALGADRLHVIGVGDGAGVLARLRAAPLTGVDGRRVTDGTATRALVVGLGDPARWPALAAALAAAGAGDPAGLLGLLAPSEADGGGFDAGVLLTCNDTIERPTVDQVARDAARARAADPLFGAYFAHEGLLCGSWPVPTETLEPGPTAAPPPLVLGTRGDPTAPLPATERVATQLGVASLVTWLGAGHGAFPATPCVRDAVTSYLRAGVLPQQGTVCPP